MSLRLALLHQGRGLEQARIDLLALGGDAGHRLLQLAFADFLAFELDAPRFELLLSLLDVGRSDRLGVLGIGVRRCGEQRQAHENLACLPAETDHVCLGTLQALDLTLPVRHVVGGRPARSIWTRSTNRRSWRHAAAHTSP